MKIAMINDCAYVGETILKYLPESVEKMHIKRSRGLWSKTFGIAYKVWRTKADVYHVHYLLQDCYLASLLGKKPLVGHAHGSDLKATMTRFALGRIVRSNLKKCDKILVSTPDLIEIARQHRKDVEYLPNPVDTKLFYPKPPRRKKGKLKVLIAGGSDWAVKGTNIAILAMAELKGEIEVSIIAYGKDLERTLTLAESLGLEMQILPIVPHEKLNEYFWNADLVMDQFKAGVFGLISLEAIACGRPVLTFLSSGHKVYEGIPLKDANTPEQVAEAIRNPPSKLWEAEHEYFEKHHTPQKVVARVMEIYQQLYS